MKQNYRQIDFLRVPLATKVPPEEQEMYQDEVVGITYDPCRSAMLAKVVGSVSQRYRLILASTGMKVGDVVKMSRGPPPEEYEFRAGDVFPIKYFPAEASVHNIETYPGSGAKMARCGDGFLTVQTHKIKKGKDYVVCMKGERTVDIDADCLATFGTTMSNGLRNLPLGKAGRARRYGIKMGGKKGILRLRDRRQRGRKNLLTHIHR